MHSFGILSFDIDSSLNINGVVFLEEEKTLHRTLRRAYRS
jgi:hypothetical protein